MPSSTPIIISSRILSVEITYRTECTPLPRGEWGWGRLRGEDILRRTKRPEACELQEQLSRGRWIIKPSRIEEWPVQSQRHVAEEWGGVGRRVKAGDPSWGSMGLRPVVKEGYAAASWGGVERQGLEPSHNSLEPLHKTLEPSYRSLEVSSMWRGSKITSHKFVKVWVWGVSFGRLYNSDLEVRKPPY